MLKPKKFASNRPRRGGNLQHGGFLYTQRSSATYQTELTLTNGISSFTFQQDKATGVRLKSCKYQNNTEILNSTSSLWCVHANSGEFDGESYGVYPSVSTFESSSFAIQTFTGGKKVIFIWRNVYLEQDKNLLFDAYYTATLLDGQAHLDLSLELREPTSIAPFPTSSQEVALAAVCVLNLALLDPSTDKTDDWLFTTPLSLGDSIVNPLQNLRSTLPVVTVSTDNGNIIQENGKILDETYYPVVFYQHPNQSPRASSCRLSTCHPGFMYTPMVSLGNKTTKNGLLVYAMDPDGLSAKNFQWWSDGRKLRLQIWDYSNYEVDPHGLGGESDLGSPYTLYWTARLRPFKSPTKHVDFYGPMVYRNEAVPNQTYVKDPLWKRALSGELDQRVAESTIFLLESYLKTGDGSTFIDAVTTYQNLIKTGFMVSYTPLIHAHAINGLPTTGQNWGWYSFGTGVTGSRNSSKLPDALPPNPIWANMWDKMYASGASVSTYIVKDVMQPFDTTTVIPYSGYDLIAKGRNYADYTMTKDRFESGVSFAEGGNAIFSVDQVCCPTAPYVREQYHKIWKTLGQSGTHMYADTLGNFYGCYAHNHIYRDGLSNVSYTHPRAGYSRFFNELLYNDYIKAFRSGAAGYATRLNATATYPLSACEFPIDVYLGYKTSSSATRIGDNFHKQHYSINPYDSAAFYRLTPYWHLLTPTMFIIHGNRMYNGGYYPHGGNMGDSNNQSYIYSGFSGFGPGFITTFYSTTDRNFRSTCFSQGIAKEALYGGRVVIEHRGPESTGDAGVGTGIYTKESQWITGSNWTGVVGLMSEWFRTVGVSKEYQPQGLLYPPLEDWAVGATGHAFNYEQNATRFSRHTGLSGEDAILHTVRKHRSRNKYLITMMNWTTGSTTFSGRFVPEVYGISGSYDIYRIYTATGQVDALNPIAIGDRILQANKTGGDYNFQVTIPARSTYLLEAGTKNVVGNLDYIDLASNYINVRYSYSASVLSVIAMTVGYSYGSQCVEVIDPPYVGYMGAATQGILNNLPQWMEMRQKTDSIGYRFVNSWGMILESVVNLTNAKLRNMFSLTADKSSRFKLYRGSVTTREAFENRASRNLLFNSGFGLRDVSRSRLPIGWTDYSKPAYQQVTLDSANSFAGSYCIKMVDNCILSQLIDINKNIKKLIGSVYIKGSNIAGSLVLSIQTIDGVNYSAETPINGTISNWQRTICSVQIDSEVYQIQMTIKLTSGTMYVACPQLESANQATEWQPNMIDKPRYVEYTLPYRFAQAISNIGTISLFPVGEIEDFTTISVPTRAEAMSPNSENREYLDNTSYGRKIDFYNKNYNTKWVARDGNLCLIDKDANFEVYKVYEIRDVRWYENFGYGTKQHCDVDRTVLATTIYDDLLFVLCKEIYRNKQYYVLKVMKPNIPPNFGDYIESFADIEIPLSLVNTYSLDQISDEVQSINFSDSDNKWLRITTQLGRITHIRLYYDYYYINPTNRNVYTIEDYGISQIQVI